PVRAAAVLRMRNSESIALLPGAEVDAAGVGYAREVRGPQQAARPDAVQLADAMPVVVELDEPGEPDFTPALVLAGSSPGVGRGVALEPKTPLVARGQQGEDAGIDLLVDVVVVGRRGVVQGEPHVVDRPPG